MKLSVVMRDDGSNVEDCWPNILPPKSNPSQSPSSPTKIGVAVEIADAAVSISDERAGMAWQAKKLSLNFGMAASDGSIAPTSPAISATLGRRANLRQA